MMGHSLLLQVDLTLLHQGLLCQSGSQFLAETGSGGCLCSWLPQPSIGGPRLSVLCVCVWLWGSGWSLKSPGWLGPGAGTSLHSTLGLGEGWKGLPWPARALLTPQRGS